MKPFLMSQIGNKIQKESDIDFVVRQDHDSYNYSMIAEYCGRVRLYGVNAGAEAAILIPEIQPEDEMIADWCSVIEEKPQLKCFTAIGVTLFKGGMENGQEIIYKETTYLNRNHSHATVFRSILINGGQENERYLPTTTKQVPLSSLPLSFAKILQKLNQV